PELSVTGWDVSSEAAAAGRAVTVTLAWQVGSELPADLTTYVHVVDNAGTTVGQSDHQAGGVFYPSQLWPTGVPLRDRHRLELPSTLAPGSYELRAGAYRFDGSGLLPLGREILLGQLTVGPESAGSQDELPLNE
ncbi:MAG TPA: hypothetical protein VER55_09070, partial [Ardenticatenaceae bacterium]|nr:hypothetical protein [Ardenticatenaceae bacterium]